MDECPLSQVITTSAVDKKDGDPNNEEKNHVAKEEQKEDLSPLFKAIQIGDHGSVVNLINQNPELTNCPQHNGLTPLHFACQMKNLEILTTLLSFGAKVELFDNSGNTALHLAVKDSWHDGAFELLQHGASPNALNKWSFSQTNVSFETPIHVAVRMGDVSSTSLLLQYKPDFNIKDSNNHSILYLAASKHQTELLELLIKEPNCMLACNANTPNGEALFLAALQSSKEVKEKKIMNTFEILWGISHEINAVNDMGESPLFLACQLGLADVVNFLLSKGSDPTLLTQAGQSSLHAACQAGCSATLKHLLSTGLVNKFITKVDRDGNSPFYFAAQSSSSDCCEILLNNGAHLTDKNLNDQTNCSLALENVPTALELLRGIFDKHISLSDDSEGHPDFSISFDYSVLVSSGSKTIQSSIVSEIIGSPAESLIKHPLLESFLYIKWNHICSFFYFYVAIFLFYSLMHTSFIFLTFGKSSFNWSENPSILILYQILHIQIFLVLFIPDVIIMSANLKKYLLQWESYSKVIALFTSVILLFLPGIKDVSPPPEISSNVHNGTMNEEALPEEEGLSTERQLAAVSSFFAWVEFMMLLGRFPELGSYIFLFARVAKSIIKFLMAFLSLIIAFSISFYIIFQKIPVFATYQIGFVKTLMMMTGEIAYSEFVLGQEMPLMGLVFLTLFMVMVSILVANLLIGLAVNDIPHLKRQGKIRRLAKEASYLVGYETFISYTFKTTSFPVRFLHFLTSKSRIKTKVSIKPNQLGKNPLDKYKIPRGTLLEAIALVKSDISSEDFSHHFDDMETLFKSFRRQYASDYMKQKRKIAKIMELCNIMKSQIDKLQDTIEENKHKT